MNYAELSDEDKDEFFFELKNDFYQRFQALAEEFRQRVSEEDRWLVNEIICESARL